MRKYYKLLPLLAIILINSCTGDSGGTDDNGNPNPAPLPEPSKVTYALIAITGSKHIYSAPIDTNGNPRWDMGEYTASNVSWENPYYIVVDSTNTYAYISDAPITPGITTEGKVYKCSLTQVGLLNNCSAIITGLERPVSLSLYQDKYLYLTNATTGGSIYKCDLTSNNCKKQDYTIISNKAPIGVATNDNQAFVTYGCLDGSCIATDNSLYSYTIDSNGELSARTPQKSSSSLSNPTDLAVNKNFLYISNFSNNNVAQYNTQLNREANPASTIFKGNFEISMDSYGKYVYIINGAPQRDGTRGYVSKCTVKSSGELDNVCTPLTDKNILKEPYGIAITGELQGPSQ